MSQWEQLLRTVVHLLVHASLRRGWISLPQPAVVRQRRHGDPSHSLELYESEIGEGLVRAWLGGCDESRDSGGTSPPRRLLSSD